MYWGEIGQWCRGVGERGEKVRLLGKRYRLLRLIVIDKGLGPDVVVSYVGVS